MKFSVGTVMMVASAATCVAAFVPTSLQVNTNNNKVRSTFGIQNNDNEAVIAVQPQFRLPFLKSTTSDTDAETYE